MNEDERAQLAHRLRAVRARRFKGNKKAAYTAAGINSGTWDRAERGEPLREHTQISIVAALWPQTGGDWTEIPDDDTHVPTAEADGLSSVDLARRIDELEAQNDVLQRRLDAAEERLEELEPSDPRSDEERRVDFHWFAGAADRFAAEAGELGLTPEEYLVHLRAEWGEPVDSPLAARRGVSSGRRLRAAQDDDAEESQDLDGQ